MFNNKKIKELEKEIRSISDKQNEFLKFAHTIISDMQNQSKRAYMYELQQEDVELIEDGKKFRKIRKILI